MSANQPTEVFLDEFEQFGPNIATRAERITDDPDVAEVIATYGGALETTSTTITETLRSQFNQMSPRRQDELNQMMTQTGGQQLAQSGNEVVSTTTTGRGLGAVSTIIEKLKWLIREWFDVPEDLKKPLKWLDKIIDNVVGLFQSG